MDSAQTLKALERERELLEDFISLSEEQLALLEEEKVEAVDPLLQRRADLMMELTAIEATLGTWISQIRTDSSVTPELMYELRWVNDEIVSMANHIVEIDEQTHERLDLIKERTQRGFQQMNRGGRASLEAARCRAGAPRPLYTGVYKLDGLNLNL